MRIRRTSGIESNQIVLLGDDATAPQVTPLACFRVRGQRLRRCAHGENVTGVAADPRLLTLFRSVHPQSSRPAAQEFLTPVYGTVFAGRAEVVQRLNPGDLLILVPDPPGIDDPNVWVHARGGDVIGHLRPDIGASLSEWMLQGGRCTATVVEVGTGDVASWRRLVIRIERLGP